ncbi:MAG: universal stress protein, partial [Chloroflexi bacterium]
KYRPLRAVLVPVAGGPNSQLAVQVATRMAKLAEDGPAKVTLLRVVPQNAGKTAMIHAQKSIAHSIEGIPYEYTIKIEEGDKVVDTILRVAEEGDYDLIVIGASNEPLFKTLLVGSIPEQVAVRSKVTTMMVKRRSSTIKYILKETVLQPATAETAVVNNGEPETEA